MKLFVSSFSLGPGNVFNTLSTSSGVHLRLIETTNSWAAAVPGSEPKKEFFLNKFYLKFWIISKKKKMLNLLAPSEVYL